MSGNTSERLRIQPVVGWPRTAEAGRSYLVTVDLEGPIGDDDWPFEEEEFEFGLVLEGAPHFRCETLGEPSVVLHRFGGTYGPARFVVTPGPLPGPGSLWLTITNRWGVPVRAIELGSRIVDHDPQGEPASVTVAQRPLPGRTGIPQQAPEPEDEPREDSPARPEPPLPAVDTDSGPVRRPAPQAAAEPEPRRKPAPVEQRPATEATSEGWITISYSGFNRSWATWIAWQLEQLGRRTTLLRWDPPGSVPLHAALSTLLDVPGQVLFVWDDRYFGAGGRTDEEWSEALGVIGWDDADRFAAVSVATRAVPSGCARLRPVDLRDLDAHEARRRVLVRLGLPVDASRHQDGDGAPRFPNDPPSVLRLPRRNSRFTGRESLLDELHTVLTQSRGARVALRGISGVGKSQIAIEYAYRFAGDYDVVWFVSAGFRATAREQLADLASSLGLKVGREIGERIRAVHEALRVGRPHRRWLVVFDGADDVDQMDALLPEGDGHVLLTTLTQEWAGLGNFVELPVEPFQRDESVSYARRRAPRLTDEQATRLADAVQDLPLLLAQTSAWLDANNMPADEYIELTRKADASQIGLRIDDSYPLGFQTAWSITLNALDERFPEASELLRLLALFSPDEVPVGMIQAAHPSDLPPHLAALADEPIHWYTALRRISESTAIQFEFDDLGEGETRVDTAVMHRLYHRFLTSTLSEERHASLSAVACAILAGADPGRPADPREWPQYARLIPHLAAAGALGSAEPAVRRLVLNCVANLHVRGEGRAGLDLCEGALARWRNLLDPDDPDVLTLTRRHAHMLRRVGRLRAAETAGRALVDRLSTVRASHDPDLKQAKSSLGVTLLSLGEGAQALRLFDEAIPDESGAENTGAAQSDSHRAIALALLGSYNESAALHQRALSTLTETLGPAHHRTLGSALSHAWMLRLLGRYREALARQENNLSALQRTLGHHHPLTLRGGHNLALCLYRVGEISRAVELMRDVVERHTRTQGPWHPDVFHANADYATFLREHGNLAVGHDLAAEVAERYRQLFGPAHPFTIGAMGNTGLMLWRTGERDEALRIAETALHDMTRAVGPDHPWTVGCALNASGAHAQVGDSDGAHALSRDAVEGARRTVGPGHPLTLFCMSALAGDLRSLRRENEARKWEEDAINGMTQSLGAVNPGTLSLRHRERPLWDFELHLLDPA